MIILMQNSAKVAFRQPHNLEIAQEQAPERAMAAGDAGDAEYVRDAEHAGDAEYAAGAAYEELEDVTEGLLVSALSGEYAAGVAYEQLEEDADYWADADVSDGEMADARLNPTVEKLAKALTNHYPEIRARKFWATTSLDNADMARVIPKRKGYELWETMVAAIMQILAFFFAAQFDLNPAFLQYPVKKVVDGSKAEQKAIKAFDQKYASRLTPEVVERLIAVWDMWSSVMQFARIIGSRAFEEYGYGLPRGSPWIEFIGLATVMAQQYKKLIEFGERKPGAIYEKSRILVHVSWLRRWLRAKINPSGFRREQSHWKHCWDIVTLRVMKNGILDVGKSRFMPAKFEFAPEPELGIVGERDTESETDDEDTDVEMATIEEEEEITADDELGEALDPRLRGATGSAAVQSEQVDVDMGGTMEASTVENHMSSDGNNGDRIGRAPMGFAGGFGQNSGGRGGIRSTYIGMGRYADGARADGNTTVYAHDPETNEYIVVTRDDPRSGTIQ
jgi:hypothetical protein